MRRSGMKSLRAVPRGQGSASQRDAPEPLEPRSRLWIWVVYLCLFAVAVPWYQPAGGPVRLWLGLPHWVVVALAAYLAVAVFTVFVVARYWSEPPGDEDSDDSGRTP